MATKKIRGITIELGADTSKVTAEFEKVSKELSSVDKSLKDVNKLLKLDPKNVELITQKQGYLADAIELTKKKIEEEKKIFEQLPKGPGEELTEQQKALQREIVATQKKLDDYQTEMEQLTSAQDTAARSADNLGTQIEEAGEKTQKINLAGILTGINQGLELVGKGAQFVKNSYDALIGDTVALADDLMTQSSVTGLSTDALQEYAYMAELVDTDVSTITGSLTKLTRNMDTATKGTGAAYEAFQKLGVDIYNTDGTLRDANDVFDEAIGKLGEVENQTERDALAMDLFGKSGQELNPIIDAGSDALEEYRKQAHETGYVLDNETLESLGSIDDSIQLLKNTMDTAKNQIATALAPVIGKITEAFVKWASSVDWVKVGQIITTVLEKIGGAIKTLIDIISTIVKAAKTAVDNIKGFFNQQWSLPKIKLPHPYISPRGWSIGDLLKGSIPSIGIDWYLKGYDGMVLDGATIFGMNKNGQLMAGGEAGREIIIGENKLKNLLGSGTTYNIVINEANNPEATAQAVMNQLQLAVVTEGRTWK